MGFTTKIDFCGLSTSLGLSVRDDDEGLTAQKYQPVGGKGAIVDTVVYGEDRAPSNSYAVPAAGFSLPGTKYLGQIESVLLPDDVTSALMLLDSITISTAARQPVSVAATSQQVADDTDTTLAPYFVIPNATYSADHVAQDPFSMLMITNGDLIASTLRLAINTTKDKLAGDNITHGVNTGLGTYSLTILQTGESNPTVSIAAPFTDYAITQPLKRKNPETEFPEWTMVIEIPLEKVYPTPTPSGT